MSLLSDFGELEALAKTVVKASVYELKNDLERSTPVDTGRLKRSIRKVSANRDRVIIGTDVPYAQAHNDGFKGPIRQRVRSLTRALTKFGITSRRQLKRSTAIEFGRVKIGETTVKAYNRTIQQDIPARPFIGQSEALEKELMKHIINRFEEAFNS
jgi:phage gpG-like protein